MTGDGGRRAVAPNVASGAGEDPAAAVAQTLRELGLHLDQWAVAGAVPPGGAPFGGSAFGAGVPDSDQSALLASLGVDAVIDTNATVRQRSLRDFLR